MKDKVFELHSKGSSVSEIAVEIALPVDVVRKYLVDHWASDDSPVWEDVPGYEGLYIVSDHGEVANAKTGHKLTPREHKKGYLRVNLIKDGKLKTYTVHRLVALAFVPNPDDLPQVNHKDEDKQNNNVNNLEWVDSVRNLSYGTRNSRIRESCNKLKETEASAAKWDGIVRCRDCEHGTQDIPSAMHDCCLLNARVSPDFFCANGKRRECA